MRYLIKHGSIIDPAQRVATVGDILVEDGSVAEVFDLAEMTPERELAGMDIEVINARGCVVAPGFTDLHTSLREPGEEHKETISTATLAAAQGGFTTVCAMPGTLPPLDHASVAWQIREIARQQAHVHVDLIGAITVDCRGITLTEMSELVEAGCRAFSNGGKAVSDPVVMRHALTYARMLDVPIMCHCEDIHLNAGWAMHEGEISTRLGLPGYPAAAEEYYIARDIALAELTSAHLHICHVSTAGGVELVRSARRRGVRITAEVTPHHLTLTDRWVLGSLGIDDPPRPVPEPVKLPTGRRGRTKKAEPSHQGLGLRSWLNPDLLSPYDPRTRVNPPFRSDADVEALVEGLRDGTIDAIATDHSPHAISDQECEYGLAACGISGLETALGLVLTLVHRGELDLVSVAAKLTEGPAQVLGRAPSTLRPGSRADLVIFDPDLPWTVDTSRFVSKGKNNPLHGQQLKGKVMLTMVEGQIVFRQDDFGRDGSTPRQASRLDGIF